MSATYLSASAPWPTYADGRRVTSLEELPLLEDRLAALDRRTAEACVEVLCGLDLLGWAEGEWHELASANQHFHRALVALAGSRRLDQQMALLLAEMRLVFHGMAGVREFHEPYLTRNAEICELLEKGQLSAAADAVAEYLDEAEQHLLAGYPD